MVKKQCSHKIQKAEVANRLRTAIKKNGNKPKSIVIPMSVKSEYTYKNTTTEC